MWTRPTKNGLTAVVVASLAIHAGVLALMPDDAPAAPQVRAPQLVEMTIAPLPTPPAPGEAPSPSAEVIAPVAPAKRPKLSRRMPAAQPREPMATPREAATPDPAPDAPADLTGMTLTNDSSAASFAAPSGSGEPSRGPIQARAGQTGGGRGSASTTGSRDESRGGDTVALADLSRPPRAPALDAALERNYPSWARAAGKSGTAVVRARVLADGRIGTTRVLTASGQGFGEACRRTLLDSRWEPPLDARRQPVATEISYTCRFEVSR